MFWLLTKKDFNKELDKIKNSFKEKDIKIDKLKETIINNSLKIATLEGAYSILSNKSQSQVSHSLNKSPNTFENRLINKIKKSRKSLVMAEIIKLTGSHSDIDMFYIIVKEKGLCSKASFYRYINSLKSQSLIKIETKTIHNKIL